SGWQWPAQGQIIARFQSNGSLNKGIDIAGQLGQPVKAAANGTVVYAGRGLLGYGDMIIIKHDETYLSAYAHNSRLLVKEGEQVRTGQTIAEMGNTGTDRVKLHFEIRRRGQPVDPLGYLPKRCSSAKQTCICTVIVLVHTAGGAGAESIATRW